MKGVGMLEISLVVFMPNITTNHAITYTKTKGHKGQIYTQRIYNKTVNICGI